MLNIAKEGDGVKKDHWRNSINNRAVKSSQIRRSAISLIAEIWWRTKRFQFNLSNGFLKEPAILNFTLPPHKSMNGSEEVDGQIGPWCRVSKSVSPAYNRSNRRKLNTAITIGENEGIMQIEIYAHCSELWCVSGQLWRALLTYRKSTCCGQ